MVHFHFTLSLRARLLQSWFLFPTVQPLFEYQGPLGFHGHGSWSMCKAALSSGVPSSTFCDQDSSWIFTYTPNSKDLTQLLESEKLFYLLTGCFCD